MGTNGEAKGSNDVRNFQGADQQEATVSVIFEAVREAGATGKQRGATVSVTLRAERQSTVTNGKQ